MMNIKCKTCRIFAAVALILINSITMADKYLVIPTGTTPYPCTGPDEVVSGSDRCWKDRNLGASRVATSLTDSLAFGDYYQWGRLGDGHQNILSPTTPTRSDHDVPGHNMFITRENGDWRRPPNSILWQGVSGINNPCPQGYRIPTEAEWNTEINSWSTKNAAGAFASPLKLVLAGYKSSSDGLTSAVFYEGVYWSSTVNGDFYGRFLYLNANSVATYNGQRAEGYSIRCIKD